jgi:hypothetical protein
MKTLVIAIGVTILFFFVLLIGCNDLNNISSEEQRFVGTWETEGDTPLKFIFLSDGTGSFSGASLNWEVNEEKFIIELMPGEVIFSYDYSFSDNGNTLKLTDVQTKKSLIYYKK